MTILALNGDITDLNMRWQAESFGGTPRYVKGHTLEHLDEAIISEIKRGTKDLIVLWENSLQQDALEEYGHAFERLEFVNRQYVLKEAAPAAPAAPAAGQPAAVAPAQAVPGQTPAPQQPVQPQKQAVEKGKPTILVINPCNAAVKGTITVFPEFVKSVNAAKAAFKNGQVVIIDMPANWDNSWMGFKAMYFMEQTYAGVKSNIGDLTRDAVNFMDYTAVDAYMKTAGITQWKLVVGPGFTGITGANVQQANQGFQLAGVNIPAIQIGQVDAGTCTKAYQLGKQIKDDVKAKKIKSKEEAVKKWIEDKKMKGRSSALSVAIGLIVEHESGENKKLAGKKRDAGGIDMKALGEVLGIGNDLATADHVAGTAFGFAPSDILKAAKAIKGKEGEKTKQEANDGLPAYVSHENWEAFAACFDDAITSDTSK
jgi:hypothetical protein